MREREQKRLEHKYGRHFPNLQQALLFDKGNNKTLRQLRDKNSSLTPACKV